MRVSHAKRALKDKESKRWTETSQAAKPVLAAASMVTAMSDRECDIYHYWASAPGPNFHLLTRMMHDRALAGGGTVGTTTAAWPFAATREVELSATPGRAARKATLSLRFGEVTILRPDGKDMKHLPKTVTLRLVEAVERTPRPGSSRPLAAVDDARGRRSGDGLANRRLVSARWIIEQLFRLMKSDGLRLEDSQLETADALTKLTAIAAKAACVILQLVQARDGSAEPASIAFSKPEIAVLDQLNGEIEGKTALQNNRTPGTAWHGPVVSSPAWAAGTVTPPRGRPARSPCATVGNISAPSPGAGRSETPGYYSRNRANESP